MFLRTGYEERLDATEPVDTDVREIDTRLPFADPIALADE